MVSVSWPSVRSLTITLQAARRGRSGCRLRLILGLQRVVERGGRRQAASLVGANTVKGPPLVKASAEPEALKR
jgi:hypothetical protein